ncbi:hypothetical protein F2Q69_00049387 [Brassica cretica]|uniref:Uncharacterized protein n=1 Tax=Brassica cretica TaxID=69181 RepID=A0A8S9PLE2_BRACR|nr:hypothetical protein F2Q69_00049387 [Brassica cretica]
MSLRTRVQSFIHRTVKIFSFCLTSTLESRSELEKLSDRLTVASPPLQRTLGIVTVEQNRVSAKARTGSEKQVYRVGLIEEEKSKRKKGNEREIRLRHHRKGQAGARVSGRRRRLLSLWERENDLEESCSRLAVL